MRVSISPRGSFIAMILASSPARLDQARYQALIAKFTQRDARHLHLAIVTARPSGHLATIAHAPDRWRGPADACGGRRTSSPFAACADCFQLHSSLPFMGSIFRV